MSVAPFMMAIWILPAIIALLGTNIITGLLALNLAGKKGYTGYFWTGFLLGLAGLVYVSGLPDNRAVK